MNSEPEDVCDVWIDMLGTFVDTPKCTLDDLNLDRFLQHALEMMKNFSDLVIGSLETYTIDRVLAFADLLFDDRLFRTLVDNLRGLDKETKRKQAAIFLLIFEVCEWKAMLYEKFKGQLSVDVDQSLFKRKLDEHIADNRALRDKYYRILHREFSGCADVRNVADQMFTKWGA